MNNNRQPKPDPKGGAIAIASFVLGIISVVIGTLSIISFFQPRIFWQILFPHGWDTSAAIALTFGIGMPGMILSIIAGLPGFILGIISLKSSKKNFAILGIIFSGIIILISIGFWLWFFLHVVLAPPLPPPQPPQPPQPQRP